MNRDAATQLILCKWLMDRVKAWEEDAKRQLDAIAGQREPVILGGIQVGSVTQAKGSVSAKVTDEHAFLEWVRQTAPTEVETIERVRPAYQTRILEQVKKVGAHIDSEGNVLDVGVELLTGEPKPTRSLNDDADIVITALLEKGRIGWAGLKAIEPPGNSQHPAQ